MRPAAFHAIDKPFGEAPSLRLKLALLLTYKSLPRPPELSTISGYFVALMVSVAESLVQSDKPHILSDVLCDASSENELWSVCKLLLVLINGACVMLLLRDGFQFQFNPVRLLVVDSTNTTLAFPRNDMTMCSKTGGADSDHWFRDKDLACSNHHDATEQFSRIETTCGLLLRQLQSKRLEEVECLLKTLNSLYSVLGEDFKDMIRGMFKILQSLCWSSGICWTRLRKSKRYFTMSPAASLCLNLKLLRPTYFLLLPLNALRMKSLGLVIRIKEVILRKKLELEEISRKMHMAGHPTCEEESWLGNTIGKRSSSYIEGISTLSPAGSVDGGEGNYEEEDSEERDNEKQVVSTFDGFRRIMESRLREDEEDRKSEFGMA
ncbi:hypothetical protein ISN45_Aa01g028110 [Arabidopsis thaliana x Arabidopsis arenosa]|uniref:Uncharacterized protein n=1 Tax=Arabidopsis thaliana x Arabidopsis arenosa TaxID=1240361 RepID=A0A8T2C8B0_9BRAS|nr:hypothetical protein ISN45_Aa01g028110 [Arabidopsis thaliana x Arabidopsis arenosa]